MLHDHPRQTILLSGLLWLIAAVLAIFDALPIPNFVGIVVFTALLYGYANTYHSRWRHNLIWLSMVVVGIAVTVYRPSGFNYPLLLSEPFLYEGGNPFSLFLNTSKGIAGYLALLWLIGNGAERHKALLGGSGAAIAVAAAGIVIVLTSAVVLLQLSFTPKFLAAALWFALVNLAVTVVAEEAFFRLIFQRHISRWFHNRWLAIAVSTSVAAVLFTLTHSLPLSAVFAVYLVAGFVYALVYAFTGRLIFSIAAHFGVNLLHFLFFEYPLPQL